MSWLVAFEIITELHWALVDKIKSFEVSYLTQFSLEAGEGLHALISIYSQTLWLFLKNIMKRFGVLINWARVLTSLWQPVKRYFTLFWLESQFNDDFIPIFAFLAPIYFSWYFESTSKMVDPGWRAIKMCMWSSATSWLTRVYHMAIEYKAINTFGETRRWRRDGDGVGHKVPIPRLSNNLWLPSPLVVI